MSYLDLVAIIVAEYDEAIRFFVDVLDFDLVSDEPSVTNDGRKKRWVVVRPKSGGAGLLLAQADGEHQMEAVGAQFAGRVGLFLRVDDFEAMLTRLKEAGVEIVSGPRLEPYGKVAVFRDVAGNKWDLLSPAEIEVPI
jgi:catechol 2,3-dioxygenase-like lactoylglutathione lyase family enzyme